MIKLECQMCYYILGVPWGANFYDLCEMMLLFVCFFFAENCMKSKKLTTRRGGVAKGHNVLLNLASSISGHECTTKNVKIRILSRFFNEKNMFTTTHVVI